MSKIERACRKGPTPPRPPATPANSTLQRATVAQDTPTSPHTAIEKKNKKMPPKKIEQNLIQDWDVKPPSETDSDLDSIEDSDDEFKDDHMDADYEEYAHKLHLVTLSFLYPINHCRLNSFDLKPFYLIPRSIFERFCAPRKVLRLRKKKKKIQKKIHRTLS